MGAPSIVRIEVRHALGVRRGSGCVVPGGYVLTAAQLVAPHGPAAGGAGGVSAIAVRVGASLVAARRVALPECWTESGLPEADLALLEADWPAGPPDAFDTSLDWSLVGDEKAALVRGFNGQAGIWHEEGRLTHVRSKGGLDAFQTRDLSPPLEAMGGPITPISRPTCLVGIVTQMAIDGGSQPLGVPVATVTYEALRQKLDLLRGRA